METQNITADEFRATAAEFLLQLMRPQAFSFAWHQRIAGVILR